MSTFTIKIDRRSIRRNKTYKPPAPIETSFSGTRFKFHHGEWYVQDFTAKRCRVIIDDFGRFAVEKPWGVKVTSERPMENDDCYTTKRWAGIHLCEPTEPEDGKIISWELHQGQMIYSLDDSGRGPSEPFRYRHVKKLFVRCRECDAGFDRNDLQYRQGSHCDCCDRGKDEAFRVCPKCGTEDCCSVVNEELSNRVLAQCARRNEERTKARKAK